MFSSIMFCKFLSSATVLEVNYVTDGFIENILIFDILHLIPQRIAFIPDKNTFLLWASEYRQKSLTMNIYTHVTTDMQIDAVNLLDSYLYGQEKKA